MIDRLLPVLFLLGLPVVATAVDDLEASQEQAFRAAVAQIAGSVVQIETVGGSDQVDDLAVGSGPTTALVVDTQGYLVSSSLNFAHAPSGILVRLPDGRRLAAQLVATDHNHKISLLQVDSDSDLPVPVFAKPESVRAGQWSIAVGRAFDPAQPNVAVGIVSALGRIWGKALQTDAAVSPNNYGGPLVDLHGHVLGLLVPMSPASDDEVAGVEWYDSGIGFAVPAGQLLEAVARLKAGEDLYPGRMGITLEKTVAMAGPAVVAAVVPNSPAAKAGLAPGDRVVRIGEENISQSSQIKYLLAARYAGDTFDLLVRRGEETIACQATLVAKLEPYRRPVLGILPERGESTAPGILVRVTIPNSPAARAGVLPGDRVVSLEGRPADETEDFRNRIAQFKPGDQVTLEVVSEARPRKLELALAPAATILPDNLPAPAIDPETAPGRAVPLTLPEWKNPIEAYLPKGYSRNTPHGLLVWMRSTAAKQTNLERWKNHADGRGLVVVLVEPSTNDRWLPGEVELVREVLRLCRKRFSLDANRIVVGGREGGGNLAYRAAAIERDHVRGCIAIDAMLAGPVAVDHPVNRFGLLIGQSDKSRLGERLDRIVEFLRNGGVPVIVLPREMSVDRLSDRDMDAMVRWIDQLDQI